MSKEKQVFEALKKAKKRYLKEGADIFNKNSREEYYGVNILDGIGDNVVGVYKGPDSEINELHVIDFYEDYVYDDYRRSHPDFEDDVMEANKGEALSKVLNEKYPDFVEHYNIKGDVSYGCNDIFEAGYITFTGDNRVIKYDLSDYIVFPHDDEYADNYYEDEEIGVSPSDMQGIYLCQERIEDVDDIPEEIRGWAYTAFD